jgi:membrane associated rhomboid family serine protease
MWMLYLGCAITGGFLMGIVLFALLSMAKREDRAARSQSPFIPFEEDTVTREER